MSENLLTIMKYYSDEVRDLKLRIFELERENEKLRRESAEYLGNWIAAQDLASWRQVLMLVKSPETPSENDIKSDSDTEM